jgi:hypothetical protein
MVDAQGEGSIASRPGLTDVDRFGICVVGFESDLGAWCRRNFDELISVTLEGVKIGERHGTGTQGRW